MPNIIKTRKKVPAKQTKKVPKKPSQLKKVRPAALAKPSTTDYYNCLLNFSRQGFYDQQTGQKLKIHACCKKCKLNAPALNNQREKELVKLISSYQQVGDSLKKLLRPIK